MFTYDILSMDSPCKPSCPFFMNFEQKECDSIGNAIDIVCSRLTDHTLVPLYQGPFEFIYVAVVRTLETVNIVRLCVSFSNSKKFWCGSHAIQLPDCILGGFPLLSFQSVELTESVEQMLLWDVMGQTVHAAFNAFVGEKTSRLTGLEIHPPLSPYAAEKVELACRIICSDTEHYARIVVPLDQDRPNPARTKISLVCIEHQGGALSVNLVTITPIGHQTNLFTLSPNQAVSFNPEEMRREFPNVQINTHEKRYTVPGYFFRPVAAYHEEKHKTLAEKLFNDKRVAVAMGLHTRLGNLAPIACIGDDDLMLIFNHLF